ncbi:unnamed protein product [Rangifer tarandus platyrhynchus]|uniref:Uncharacterized protein n=1 Tax=Rangifer tarandus platyrhynchus TaxID=3082113 RepID=A0AC59YFJ0_RANTA
MASPCGGDTGWPWGSKVTSHHKRPSSQGGQTLFPGPQLLSRSNLAGNVPSGGKGYKTLRQIPEGKHNPTWRWLQAGGNTMLLPKGGQPSGQRGAPLLWAPEDVLPASGTVSEDASWFPAPTLQLPWFQTPPPHSLLVSCVAVMQPPEGRGCLGRTPGQLQGHLGLPARPAARAPPLRSPREPETVAPAVISLTSPACSAEPFRVRKSPTPAPPLLPLQAQHSRCHFVFCQREWMTRCSHGSAERVTSTPDQTACDEGKQAGARQLDVAPTHSKRAWPAGSSSVRWAPSSVSQSLSNTRRRSETAAGFTSASESSLTKNQSRWALIFDFLPPELRENSPLLFKLPPQRHCVTAARAN